MFPHPKLSLFLKLEPGCSVKANYKNGNSDIKCRECDKFEENQPHLLICEELNKNLISKQTPVYEDIFSENFDKLKLTANKLQEIKREVLNPASWKKRSK